MTAEVIGQLFQDLHEEGQRVRALEKQRSNMRADKKATLSKVDKIAQRLARARRSLKSAIDFKNWDRAESALALMTECQQQLDRIANSPVA